MRHHIAVAAAALTVVLCAAAAVAQPARNESAEQNVRQSHQYESLLCSNPGFRAKRVAQECGPVTDPQLHQSCVASFECDKPAKPVRWRHAPPSQTTR